MHLPIGRTRGADRRIGAVSLGFSLAVATVAFGGVERAVVLRGARVESPGIAASDGVDVLVREGVIVAVEPGIPSPPDAVVLDAAGLTIVPAFVDAWSVAFSAEAPKREVQATARPIDEGVVIRMDPDSRIGRTPEATVELAFPWKDATKWREAGFGAFLAVPLGTGMRGRSAAAWLVEDGATLAEATLTTDVFQHVDLSINGPGYPSTLMGVLAAYRQYLADAERNAEIARKHAARGKRGPRPLVDAGFDAVLAARASGQRFVIPADTKESIRAALSFCREAGLAPAIAGGAECAAVIPELKAAKAFVFLGLDFPKPAGDDNRGSDPTASEDHDQRGHCADCMSGAPLDAAQDPAPSKAAEPAAPAAEVAAAPKGDEKKDAKKKRSEFPATVIAERDAERAARIGGAKALAEAGIPFAFTAKDLKSPADFRANLKLALDAGLSRDAALAALSRNAAELIGIDDAMGGIEPGRLAAFCAFRGDPLDPQSKVRFVVLGGERFEFELPKDEPTKATEGAKPAASSATNISGTWAMRVDMGDSAREYQITFDQKEGRLAGTSLSGSGSSGEITGGSVSGETIEFTIVIAPAGRHYEFVYTGKVSGDQMSGTVSINGGEGHPWSANRTGKPQESN